MRPVTELQFNSWLRLLSTELCGHAGGRTAHHGPTIDPWGSSVNAKLCQDSRVIPSLLLPHMLKFLVFG